jgi:hypothetical protein
MKPKVALILSVLLNVVLAGAAYHFATHRSKLAPEPTATEESAPAAKQEAQQATTAPVVAVTFTNQMGKSFGWEMVESEDYRKYIANLRAIGCPEETIRDIIIADVNKLFEQRRKEITASTNKVEFWKSGNPLAMMGNAFNPERLEKIQALNKEKRALLKELLGVEPELKADFMAGMNPFETMLDFLPASKQSQISEIYTKFQSKQVSVFDGGMPTSEDMKKMTDLQKEMDAELAAALTPQEYEDYQLRMSQTAMMMRRQLGSFEPNEKEFRDLFKLRKEFDDAHGGLFGQAAMTPEERRKMNEDQKALNAQIKTMMGDARYSEYERSQDYSYQQLHRLAERNGVPKDATVKAYDMQKLAQEKAREIRSNKELTSQQRNEALKAVRAETESALQKVLGEKTWESFQRQPGAMMLRSISPDATGTETTPAESVIIQGF